jgi:putative tricarboxylic transport membrane protein
VDVDAPGAAHPAPPRRRVRSPRDLLAGASLVALALLALWTGARLDAGTLRAVGPGMLPRAVATAIGLCGILLVAFSFFRDGESLGRWPLRGPVFVCLAVIAFSLTIRSVGLALAGPLVVIVGGAASPESRPRELVVFALVMTVLCIGLFRYVLSLPIPVLHIPGLVVL